MQSEKALTSSDTISISKSEPKQQVNAEASLARPNEPEAVKSIVSERPSATPARPTMKAVSEHPTTLSGGGNVVGAKNGMSNGKGKSKEIIPEITRSRPSQSSVQAAGIPKAQNTEAKSLASALSKFMETQNALAQATGSGIMPTANPADVVSPPSSHILRC
jgi:hypothetical protein